VFHKDIAVTEPSGQFRLDDIQAALRKIQQVCEDQEQAFREHLGSDWETFEERVKSLLTRSWSASTATEIDRLGHELVDLVREYSAALLKFPELFLLVRRFSIAPPARPTWRPSLPDLWDSGFRRPSDYEDSPQRIAPLTGRPSMPAEPRRWAQRNADWPTSPMRWPRRPALRPYSFDLRAEESSAPAAELEVEGGSVPDGRYANVALIRETGGILKPWRPMAPGTIFRLRLDIGRLSVDSAVEEPQPLPEHLLPKEDIWLDVMLSSTDFGVGPGYSSRELFASQVVQGRLFLPKDGKAARTPSGSKYLYFYMQAPEEPGIARARIGYYYKNHLIQSQSLVCPVGEGECRYTVRIDYTLSQSLADLEQVPCRPQVTFLTNDNGDGSHTIVVRAGDAAGSVVGEPRTYGIREDAVDRVVDRLREALRDRVAPAREKKRSKRQLIADLRELAPLGWKLWSTTVGQRPRPLYEALVEERNPVVQVARPTTAGYVFPWGLIYDFPLHLDDDWALDERRKEVEICPVVDRWDEVGPMVGQGLRRCPEAPNGHREQVLCPFGFWAYRYPVEQLSSTDQPVLTIQVPEEHAVEMVVAETKIVPDPARLSTHIDGLRATMERVFPEAKLWEGKDLQTIRTLLGRENLPLLYFYCHGERPVGSSDTYLGVGDREEMRAEDFQGWVLNWLRHDRKKVWNQVRPLVFVNACHSVEIHPDTLVSYLTAFVSAAHAAGLIGTEVKVRPSIAMDIAARFFERFLEGQSVDQALHEVRLDYLAQGNLYGLIYTPYCWADLRLAHA